MADQDLEYSLQIIEKLNDGLQNALKTSNVGNEKNHEDLVNKFVANTKTHYTSSQDPDRKVLISPDANMKMLYQNIGEDFKDLVNKLSLDQKQKDEATQIVAKYTNLALESAGFTPLPLSSAGKIIAEDAHKDYQEVVDSLPMTNKNQMEAQAKYKTDFDQVISDPKRGNILDEIAKLNAKLQKDLNLNDRQINELNIGAGHYIHNHRENFHADLKENMSREDITELLDVKTAKSTEKLNQTRAQAAKSVVISASKRATTNFKAGALPQQERSNKISLNSRESVSQTPAKWKKVERSGKNPKTAASDYQKSQEIPQKPSDTHEITQKPSELPEQPASDLNKTVEKGKKNTVSSTLKNVARKVEKISQNPTKPERAYHNTVTHLEREAIEKAEKLGKEISDKAKTAAALAKDVKNRIKTLVKDKWQGKGKGPAL